MGVAKQTVDQSYIGFHLLIEPFQASKTVDYIFSLTEHEYKNLR